LKQGDHQKIFREIGFLFLEVILQIERLFPALLFKETKWQFLINNGKFITRYIYESIRFRSSRERAISKHSNLLLGQTIRNFEQPTKQTNSILKKEDQRIQTNINYIIQQNLNLINNILPTKDLFPAASEEKLSVSPPLIKNQYQIIYNNIKSTKFQKKIWDDDLEKTSEMSLIRREETRPETQLSIEKFQHSLAQEYSKDTLKN